MYFFTKNPVRSKIRAINIMTQFCLYLKNRDISKAVLLKTLFLYNNVQNETIFEVIRGECWKLAISLVRLVVY